jgi:hypothetical protein
MLVGLSESAGSNIVHSGPPRQFGTIFVSNLVNAHFGIPIASSKVTGFELPSAQIPFAGSGSAAAKRG